MSLWTSEDISKILIRLDDMNLPFKKYSFVRNGADLNLLGRGGSAEVYEAETRKSHKNNYAIKVIGFRNQNADSEFFNESVQVQKDIGDSQDNVVKVYDYTELWVSFDENDNIISAVKERPDNFPSTSIKLQFVVMEKIFSVIERTKGGNIKMMPEKLAVADEQEVLKLAYDIGIALQSAHNKNVLHRDVKLENVFYCERKKQYKLGDFGIAKKTENGFAGTIAFTKGYAAPEVRGTEERYDNTADIYSFGMMLYVLMNNLKFPDSNTYNVNSSVQYSTGYIVPYPDSDISEDFYSIITKACMYDPDQRYQSMEEMILDIERLMYSDSYGYKKEHKNESLVVGTILLAIGTVAWKLTMASELSISFGLWEYIFLIACLGKGILKIFKKNVVFASLIVMGVGIYLLLSSGFTWLKLLFLLWMTFSSGTSSGYVSVGILTTNFLSLIQQAGAIEWHLYTEYNWIAITAISLSFVFLFQYEIVTMENRQIFKKYYKNNIYWILVCIIFTGLIFLGPFESSIVGIIYTSLFGNEYVDVLNTINFRMVGITGLGFSIFWIVREKILFWINN